MHSNGLENGCGFACICVTKIYCAGSSSNWMMKAPQPACQLEINYRGGGGVAGRCWQWRQQPGGRAGGPALEPRGPREEGRAAIPQQSGVRALLG